MAAEPLRLECNGLKQLSRVIVALFAWFHLAQGGNFEDWGRGRATFFGDDEVSIHAGTCMFGQLDPNKGTGLHVAAISDKAYDYAGSCGRCYEVACRPATIGDGQGGGLDRKTACNGADTVTVKVTDTCPCYLPDNMYSNTRWCCGDQYHMDLSKSAFAQLAGTEAGVIGIYYRVVDCPGESQASEVTSTPAAYASSFSGPSNSGSAGSGGASTSDGSSSSHTSGVTVSFPLAAAFVDGMTQTDSAAVGSGSSSSSSSGGVSLLKNSGNSWFNEVVGKVHQHMAGHADAAGNAIVNKGHHRRMMAESHA